MSLSIAPPDPSIRWHFEPELARLWPEPWPVPGWLTSGVARIVKKGPQRTVLRVDLPEMSFYVKQHHLPDRVTWVRQCLRAPKGRREFDRLRRLADLGVPAPRALGWGTSPGWLGVGESFVVTRAIDDVAPLHRILAERPLTGNERQELAAAVGRFLARLHMAGVDHHDLHLGNIVARWNPGVELFLVDLDAVRLGKPLSRPQSLSNLTLFCSGTFPGTGRTDRFRGLAHYMAERGWTGPCELSEMAREIEEDAWERSLAFWAHRDRRCLVGNRYYERVSSKGYTGMAVRGLDDAWLERMRRDPEALFRDPGVVVLKHSKSSTVAEITVPIDGQPRAAILKKIVATKASDPWAALVRASPVLRSWIWGHGFLERELPTPRPLVMLHETRAGLWHDGYLVTEKLDDIQELDDYVAGLASLPAEQRQTKLRAMIGRVARAVHEMHRRRLSHRDLKAANMLVTALAVEGTDAGAPRRISTSPFSVAETSVWFIDLVGVTRHKYLTRRRCVQNVARLNASFLASPLITRSDRLRFLGVYLRWDLHGKSDWKTWWRAIAAATSAKAERNRKSGRVLG